MKKYRIMFVCHGNICRSPMAEFIFRDMLEREGYAEDVEVASSATSTEEIWYGVGNPVYPPAARELRKHGIDPGDKRARKLLSSDYPNYDLFIGMDSANIRNMHRIFGTDPECKIKKLMEFTPKGTDVADPWYTSCFDVTYRDIHEGCAALIEVLKNNLT